MDRTHKARTSWWWLPLIGLVAPVVIGIMWVERNAGSGPQSFPASFLVEGRVRRSEGIRNSGGRLGDHGLSREIELVAMRHRVPARLILAVIHAESGFDRCAVSKAGARGLMQIMPDTAASLGVRDSLDARENLDGGVRYLRWLLDRFGGDTRLALAAYNAGPEAVAAYGGIPPYPETEGYVARVLGMINLVHRLRVSLRCG